MGKHFDNNQYALNELFEIVSTKVSSKTNDVKINKTIDVLIEAMLCIKQHNLTKQDIAQPRPSDQFTILHLAVTKHNFLVAAWLKFHVGDLINEDNFHCGPTKLATRTWPTQDPGYECITNITKCEDYLEYILTNYDDYFQQLPQDTLEFFSTYFINQEFISHQEDNCCPPQENSPRTENYLRNVSKEFTDFLNQNNDSGTLSGNNSNNLRTVSCPEYNAQSTNEIQPKTSLTRTVSLPYSNKHIATTKNFQSEFYELTLDQIKQILLAKNISTNTTQPSELELCGSCYESWENSSQNQEIC